MRRGPTEGAQVHEEAGTRSRWPGRDDVTAFLLRKRELCWGQA